MAVAPSCQIHTTTFLDSLHSSFHKLRTPNLPFVRRSYSLLPPRRKLHFYVNPIHAEQNPSQKPNSFPKPNNKNNFKPLPTEDSSQKPTWIDKWSETRFRNLPKRPAAVLDYRNGGVTSEDDEVGSSRSTGSGTMEKIVEKLKKFGYIDDVGERKERVLPEKGSVEDIFYAEEGVLPNSRGGLSLDLNEEVRFPWEKKPLEGERESEGGDSSSGRMKRSRTSLAELTLPEGELRRLRHLAIRTKSKTKIGGAGVSKEIVDKIHEKWMTEELVRLKCEGPPALNMKRMHEILERKTGGLVIWRSGSSISLYRGASYELPQPEKNHVRKSYMTGVGSSSKATYRPVNTIEDGSESKMQALSVSSTSSDEKKEVNRSSSEINYEQEVDRLLDGLGPRYTDWPGCDPLPVDADLLPGVAPGYRPPFRILPYGVRSTLGNKEMTALRRLARVLPPHFALGRSRQHQGLALAMMKLWERSSIAKIALKRGVQLTSSERMAEDIKKLTGSTVISRNKDYIVFYRGKDFLSPEVTEALMERERMTKALQEEEEQARIRATTSIISNIETNEEAGTAGTLGETLEADARWGKRLDVDDRNKMMRAAEVARHAELVRKLDWKLFQAERKLMKAENALAKVEEFLKPAESKPDPESITDEERFMFRKLGLRMKAFLLLGRRGVFDGTVENMHLHWKYRELVKILVKAKTFSQVRNVALSLEAESGGILVSVDKISKGFAIIVYRGKDYKRPPTLRPKNLLTKRKALARSIELQRREALYGHITRLNRRVEQLRSELDQMEFIKGQGDEELYAKLDSAYLSDDDDTEDEGDEAYLETIDDSVITDSDEAEGYDDSEEDSNVNLHSGLNSHCKDPTVVQETYAESSGSCEPNPEGAEVDIKDVIEFCDSR